MGAELGRDVHTWATEVRKERGVGCGEWGSGKHAGRGGVVGRAPGSIGWECRGHGWHLSRCIDLCLHACAWRPCTPMLFPTC